MLWDYRISLRFKVKVNMAVDNLVNESVLHHYNKIPEVINLQNIKVCLAPPWFSSWMINKWWWGKWWNKTITQRKKSEEGPGLILPRLILNDNEFLFLYLVSVGIHMCGDRPEQQSSGVSSLLPCVSLGLDLGLQAWCQAPGIIESSCHPRISDLKISQSGPQLLKFFQLPGAPYWRTRL